MACDHGPQARKNIKHPHLEYAPGCEEPEPSRIFRIGIVSHMLGSHKFSWLARIACRPRKQWFFTACDRRPQTLHATLRNAVDFIPIALIVNSPTLTRWIRWNTQMHRHTTTNHASRYICAAAGTVDIPYMDGIGSAVYRHTSYCKKRCIHTEGLQFLWRLRVSPFPKIQLTDPCRDEVTKYTWLCLHQTSPTPTFGQKREKERHCFPVSKGTTVPSTLWSALSQALNGMGYLPTFCY